MSESVTPAVAPAEPAKSEESPANGAGQTLVKAPPERVPVLMGVAPRNVDEGWRLAQYIAQSALVPKGYQGKPADVLVAIQFGMEVGLPPLAALHSIFVANGRPSLWGDGFLAVIMGARVYKDHDEYYLVNGQRHDFLTLAELGKDDTMAVCTFWRTDRARPATATFSVGQAKKAGLWGKEGPWQQYPDRMLKFRARGFAGRDAFPDVLRGISTAEEAKDLSPELPPEPPKEVRRLSERVQEAPRTSQAPAGTAIAVSPGPTAPSSSVTVLDPQRIVAVEQFLGGYTVRLQNGKEVDVVREADAAELEKYVGTNYYVRVRVTRGPGADELLLHSFEIAD